MCFHGIPMASKVLDTMRKLQPSGTVPFSLKQQYVPVVRAAQEAAGPGNGEDGEDEEQAPVPPGRKRKSPSKDCESKPHQEWNYSTVMSGRPSYRRPDWNRVSHMVMPNLCGMRVVTNAITSKMFQSRS